MAQRILSVPALALGGAALMLGGCSSMASDATMSATVVATASPPAEDLDVASSGTAAIGLADAIQSDVSGLIKLNAPLNADGTMGSGCDVQEDDALPDGMWFGFVSAMADGEVTVDVACMFGEGSEQWTVDREMATDDEEWSNHVVTNDVVHKITTPVADDVLIYAAQFDWDPVTAAEALAAVGMPGARESVGLWLEIEDGSIVTVIEPSSATAA
ncbi:hypothetical protein [Demequina sp. NBRC 110057]|uniref:hypothetical protein n=1 Tax=Demequina sp. NBRC 110057 TaxID=1570346 RepID=UPI000A04C991|nr:hypothetical protein [Demequina sp. NBRC 110057]